MLITPYSHSLLTGNSDGGNYMFTDSVLYLKNASATAVQMEFWASVLVAVPPADSIQYAAKDHGSFVHVSIFDALNSNSISSFEMKYEGISGYGDDSIRETFPIPAQSTIIFKTVLIYDNSLLRVKLDGNLYCAKSMENLNAFNATYFDRHDID